MGLPRRRSRLVHIDGTAYRWLATPHWHFDINDEGEQWRRTLLFADLYVEKRLQPASQLRVRLYTDWLLSWGRDPLDRRSIDPPMVRRAVSLALLRGWDPPSDGPPHSFAHQDVNFLQTPRHLLYAMPIIARVTVRDVQPAEPGCTSVTARVIERLKGTPAPELRLHLPQPAAAIPRDALVFLKAEPTQNGMYVGWSWYGSMFCISRGAALLYDDSGEERRWKFRSLRTIRKELQSVLELPVIPPELEMLAPIEEE